MAPGSPDWSDIVAQWQVAGAVIAGIVLTAGGTIAAIEFVGWASKKVGRFFG